MKMFFSVRKIVNHKFGSMTDEQIKRWQMTELIRTRHATENTNILLIVLLAVIAFSIVIQIL